MPRRKRPHGYPTPWQRIIEAATSGTGCRLSADEVFRLGSDDAIRTRAMLDDLTEEDLIEGHESEKEER